MIKAVIFDMDGVLIDAKEWHYLALNRALDLFGQKISRHDHVVNFDGRPTREKLEMLSAQTGFPRSLHSLVNKLKQKYTIQLVNELCAPKFQHQFLLSKLKREGFSVAVASNSIKDTVAIMMSRARLINYLDFYLSNEDVKKGKPDPEIYISAINKLGLTPAECVIVEDNPHGIAAATASKAHVLQVKGVDEVNYVNVMSFIESIERGK